MLDPTSGPAVTGAGGVVVITDSTASLPPGCAERVGLREVPLQVVIEGTSRAEGSPGAAPEVVADAIRAGRRVTTSRPSIDEFANAYRAAASAGATAIVVVSMSGQISSTVDAARVAAGLSPVPVRIVDSHQVAMALGFAALAAAEAARAGADVATVVRVAVARAEASETYFLVDDLEYLWRGGRLGGAAALVGSALAVNPLLSVRGGEIVCTERVRTRSRAQHRLEQLARAAIDRSQPAGGADRLAVHYLDDPGPAEALAERLQAHAPGVLDPVVGPVSAVLGAHVGPRTLGVVVSSET